jgi:RNA polymerase sigma factor (sigma-70 family)
MPADSPLVPGQLHVIQSVYLEHGMWLRSWLRRRLGCPHQSEDLSQDTFLRLLTSRTELDLSEPRALLVTIAQRVLFSFWRRRSLEQSWLDALASQPQAFAPSPEDIALVSEAILAIDRLLDGLPARVKHAFLLNRLEGRTHVAIADELGVSVATVERHVRQAYLHCYQAALTAESGER